MPIPFLQRSKSLEELQEENEKAEVEYSLEQKRAMIRELKKRGVDAKSFGTWGAIKNWLKTH